MGAKRLKAVAARGNLEVPIADSDAANRLRGEHIAELRGVQAGKRTWLEMWQKYGTSSGGWVSAYSGDTPVKNWGGVGIIDFPDRSGLAR